MRGHKPGVAEIEWAVKAQRQRVEDAGDRHRRAARVSGYGAAIEARRVLEGALKRLTELEAQLAEARREEEVTPGCPTCGAAMYEPDMDGMRFRRRRWWCREHGSMVDVEGLREPATFVCSEATEARMQLLVRGQTEEEAAAMAAARGMTLGQYLRRGGAEAMVALSGDPGDEDWHVSARRGVQIHVRLIMQYRSRFVHATPHSADELAARQRVELLQGRLQELIDEGLLEGYKVEQVEYDVLQKGA